MFNFIKRYRQQRDLILELTRQIKVLEDDNLRLHNIAYKNIDRIQFLDKLSHLRQTLTKNHKSEMMLLDGIVGSFTRPNLILTKE
jgi:hypothetical protein